MFWLNFWNLQWTPPTLDLQAISIIFCLSNFLGWFGLLLWHVNYCRLFNAKSILYIWLVLFRTVQYSISTQFSSIWPIDWNLSDANSPGQSGPGSNDNKGVLCIPQSSTITGASPSDCLCHIQDTRWGSFTFFKRCSQCILQPQPIGPFLEMIRDCWNAIVWDIFQSFGH